MSVPSSKSIKLVVLVLAVAAAVVVALMLPRACADSTVTRVEQAWRTYLDATYGREDYTGPVTVADLEQMARTGCLYGRLRAEDKGLSWHGMTERQRQVYATTCAVECLFVQMYGSVDAGREIVTPGTWADPADGVAWVAALAGLKAEVARSCR